MERLAPVLALRTARTHAWAAPQPALAAEWHADHRRRSPGTCL